LDRGGYGTRILRYRAMHDHGLLETNKENIMTIRIVIIAACAGTLALAQADVARAQSSLVNSSHSNIRHPGEVKTPSIVRVEGITELSGDKVKGSGGNTGAKANNPKTNPSSPASNGLGIGGVILPQGNRR
jgi:hypothetical protein